MPYCGFLYNGVCINTKQQIKPCCHIKSIPEKTARDWEEFDWSLDTNFAEVEQEMQGDNWSSACYRCQREEEKTGQSPRTRFNEKYVAEHNKYTFWDLKISNTCNLMCVSCNPQSSSKWATLVSQNLDKADELSIDYYTQRRIIDKRPLSWHKETNTILDVLKENVKETKILKFTGGEPLLIKQVKDICKIFVDNNLNSNVNLKLITNGQADIDEEWSEIFDYFNYVDLTVSIDGIGSRYEYIRRGSSWDKMTQFMDHVTKLPNVCVQVAYLQQTLNAAVKQQTQDWVKQYDLDIDNDTEILDEPSFLNYSSLKPHLRERYGIDTIHEYSEEQFKKMVKYMETLDKLHGTDIRKECPELFE